jgi:hypothetical protein
MDEQAEKVISWLKERKIFAWMVGSTIFTYMFVLFFYYLARIVHVINTTLPDPSWELDTGRLFYNVVGGIGLMGIIVIPALSFFVVRKFTNIFLIESEEKERWRQRELKRIVGDLKNARKMIWNMGFSKELTDAMYKKTQWTEPERAEIHTIIEILSEHVKKKKKEEPPKEIRSDEIKYLVQQKRKKAARLAKDLLEEEKKRRNEELELLEELIEDVDEVDFDDEPIDIPSFIVEKPAELKAAEDEVVYHDINTHPVTKKMLEADSEKVVEIPIPEMVEEVIDEEMSNTDFVASLQSDVITIKEDDEMIEAISQEEAKEILEEFEIEEEDTEKKRSLRDVIGEAMTKITEAEETE